MSGRYTYKDELCKRLKVAFPRLNEFKIKRIAQDIMDNKSNNPSIIADETVLRIRVESWDCEYPSEWSENYEKSK